MRFRHLDYAADAGVDELGTAAIDDLLDRGDLTDWAPLAAAIADDPFGDLAETVLHLCDAHQMYGTSALWRSWIGRLRGMSSGSGPRALSLSEARRRLGLTQEWVSRRMGISQSDVSKLERRRDIRVSTLRDYVAATGGRLDLVGRWPVADEDLSLSLELGPGTRDR
jgi:hypothetical protein